MAKIGRSDVEKLATLSRLQLTEGEMVVMTEKLNAIFGYLEMINSAPVEGVEPMSHVHGSLNVIREDRVEPSMPNEELLKIAPDTSGRFIKTPLVIEGA